MALTTDRLRSILGGAIGGPETDVAGYIAALVKRRLLPADDTPLNARSVAVALLAVLCGKQPTPWQALFTARRSRRKRPISKTSLLTSALQTC
jgi:hypothetical protein